MSIDLIESGTGHRENAQHGEKRNALAMLPAKEIVMTFIAGEQKRNEMRSISFDESKMRSPLWDMLLVLLAHKLDERKISVSNLCLSCDAPDSTALRQVHKLIALGLAYKYADTEDKRRSWIAITDKALERFGEYFNALQDDGQYLDGAY